MLSATIWSRHSEETLEWGAGSNDLSPSFQNATTLIIHERTITFQNIFIERISYYKNVIFMKARTCTDWISRVA